MSASRRRELIGDRNALRLATRSLGEANLDHDHKLEHRLKLLEAQVHRLQESLREMSEQVQRLLEAPMQN